MLGAYPSALHVRWEPPAPYTPVMAFPVDDEPEPLWAGYNEVQLISRWKSEVGYLKQWGRIEPAGRFNGSSGVWLEENVLEPLSAPRTDAWITDCLDTYRCSKGVSRRLDDTYRPFAEQLGLPRAVLLPHPSEDEIVAEALAHHRERLLGELAIANPRTIITLGNAALRVIREIVKSRNELPSRLSSEPKMYGCEYEVWIGEDEFGVVNLLPLAHPAAPMEFQKAHQTFVERLRTKPLPPCKSDSAFPPLTAENIDAILRFLPEFEVDGCLFGKFVTPKPMDDGTTHMPYAHLSKDVMDFYKALYDNNWIVPFNWVDWQYEAFRYCKSPELLSGADLDTLRRLLTTHVRKDRFVEGHLLDMFKKGHIVGILTRLKNLRDAMSLPKP